MSVRAFVPVVVPTVLVAVIVAPRDRLLAGAVVLTGAVIVGLLAWSARRKSRRTR